MREALQAHGALSRGAFAVAVLVSFAVLFAPAADVPPAPRGVDVAVHLVLFLALALTGRWAGARPAPLAVLLVLHAAVSEVVQPLLLDRTGSVADLVADGAGVLLGMSAWAAASRRAARRRPPG